MMQFVPGMELAEGFYHDVVGQLIKKQFPELKFAAALMGGGSDVLGFDTKDSMDHDWGPRLQVFVENGSDPKLENDIRTYLQTSLPFDYRGFPTNFRNKANEKRVRIMSRTDEYPVNHLIEVATPGKFAQARIGVDASQPLTEREWLSISQNRFLEVVAGKVFHDEIGLNDLRARINWYPKEIWFFMMGCLWWRMRRWERSMGHSGYLGDNLGASVLAGRIARDIMRIAFLMEKTYAPYSKWFGSSFAQLACAPTLGPQLEAFTQAAKWEERDLAYEKVIKTIGTMHNDLRITHYKEPIVRTVNRRKFRVALSDKFSRGLFSGIESKYLSGLFQRGITGNIDLITDNIDVVLSATMDGKILEMFEPLEGEEVTRPEPWA